MDKLEYWFLDTAVEMVIGLSWVIPDEKYGTLGINRAPLNLTVTKIADMLHSLFQQGDLLVTTPSDLNDFGFTRGFTPSYTDIKAALEGQFPLFYFLIPQGGVRWESVSRPKWEWYFKWVEGTEPIDEGDLACANRELAEKLLALCHLLSSGNCHSYLIAGTEVWERLTPWQPTYWKTLPVGYRVRYQRSSIEIDELSEQSLELIESEKQATAWYAS